MNKFIKILIIPIFILGFLFLLFGIISVFSPNSIFYKFVLKLANIFSQVGYIRQEATIQFIYRDWIQFGLPIIIITGFMLILLGFIWYRLEKERKEEFSINDFNIDTRHPPKKSLYVIVIIIITIIGAVLRSVNLNQSFWGDEIKTVVDFIRPFKFWRYLELGDHWIYSFLGFVSIGLFGENEIAVRLPAFILGIITIPAIYFLMRDLISDEGALLASIMLCFSASHIRYSNEARGYSALVLFSLISSSLFLRIISNSYPAKRKKEILLFSACTCLGCLSHFYYIWVLFAQCFTIFSIFITERLMRKKIILKGYLCSNLLTAMLMGSLSAFIIYGPALIPAIIKKYLFWKGKGEVVAFTTIGQLISGTPNNIYGLSLIILILFGLVDFWRKQKKNMVFYFIFLIGPPLIIVKIICKRAAASYFIYSLPFLIIGLAYSITILVRRFSSAYLRTIVLSVLTIIFIIIQLPMLTTYYRYHKSGVQDYRSVGRLIDGLAKKEDIILSIGIGRIETQYYIKKHKIKHFNEQEFYKYVDSNKSKIWCVVTFPEYIHVYPEAARMYEFAKKRLKLLGHFPGFRSDLIMYAN